MKKIPLSGKNGKGKFAIVDDGDYPYLSQFKWYLSARGYAVREVGVRKLGTRRCIFMHQEVCKVPKGFEPDHEDGNKLNNQRYNLRKSTRSQNMFNKGKHADSVGLYKGIAKCINANTWFARICVRGSVKYLGARDNPHDAAELYNKAALKYHGKFAYLNIIKRNG